jgi:hypothetical protein
MRVTDCSWKENPRPARDAQVGPALAPDLPQRTPSTLHGQIAFTPCDGAATFNGLNSAVHLTRTMTTLILCTACLPSLSSAPVHKSTLPLSALNAQARLSPLSVTMQYVILLFLRHKTYRCRLIMPRALTIETFHYNPSCHLQCDAVTHDGGRNLSK